MPSDERVGTVLELFRRQHDAFRAAVGNTVDQVRTYLGGHATQNGGRVQRVAAELGAFAQDRIDVDRFASVIADQQTVDPVACETMEHALTTLTSLTALGSDLFVVDLEPGADLGYRTGKALEEIGRAFGAARVFELSRMGQYRNSAHARSLGSFPFARWNRTERRLTPPLVVLLTGSDLHAGRVAEFLDGCQKLVLVVRGECAPAPLVRLITPRTFVMQCANAADVKRLASWEGPGIAAVVPDNAALFVHDPDAGHRACDRIVIERRPDTPPRAPVGGLSVRQQIEELEQLDALAEPPEPAPRGEVPVSQSSAPAVPPSDPVDKLAAWLLSHADLTEVE